MATVHAHKKIGKPISELKLLHDENSWGFIGLLMVTGTLFLRPADLLPQLKNVAVYQLLILTTAALSYAAIGEQLKQRKLADRPVTVCLLLLIGSVTCSHLFHGFLWGAQESTWIVVKLFALYLLIISLVHTTQRLELFIGWLLIAITLMSSLALADKFGWIDLVAFAPIEEAYHETESHEEYLSRIRGSGIFEDPNDMGLVLVLGIILNFYFLSKPKQGWLRYFWLIPVSILFIALAETHSRGAFIALAVAIPAGIYYHRGWQFAVAGSVLVLPIIGTLFAGRMTDFNSVYEGTGQSRIQIWSETLTLFKQSPLFGIGEGMVAEEIGMVSHNSFLQTYAELGFFGGTIFLAAFLAAAVGLIPERKYRMQSDPIQTRMHAAIFSSIVAYCVGILALSRQFVAPTYLILGLATAAQMSAQAPPLRSFRFGNQLIFGSCILGMIFLGCIYLFTRMLNVSS